MLDLTFLSVPQLFGKGKIQLDILKKYGTKCAITDFAILLGGYVSDTDYTSEGENINNRSCSWWTRELFRDQVSIVTADGLLGSCDCYERKVGFRPALPYSSISSISSNRVRENSLIKEIEYGEYPQWVVDENYSRELEKAYDDGSLKTTGKSYTTDSVRCIDKEIFFKARSHTEYEYNGKKYIHFIGDSNCQGQILSDGRTLEKGQSYWVCVEPIIWMVDEKEDIALSKYSILSGIHFCFNSSFEETFIKQFMDTYLAKEIECLVIKDKLIENKENKSYDFDSIFEDAINKMNEINEVEKPKTLSLK